MTSLSDRLASRLTAKAAVRAALISATFALLAAPLGGIGAYMGAVGAAERNAEASVDAETRERRSQVYSAYLASVLAAADAANEVRPAYTSYESVQDSSTLSALEAAVTRYRETLREVDVRGNDVYVFGSDAAWSAQFHLREALPEISFLKVAEAQPDGTVAMKVVGPGVYDLGADDYDSKYKAFQNVFCQEASPDPRGGCTEDHDGG